jgi:hypothetical protein
MEIKIRNLEPATVQKIDELAREKGISRQEYLKRHLESFAISGLHSDIIDRYEKQLQVNNMLLEKNTQTMNEMIEIFKELMFDE